MTTEIHRGRPRVGAATKGSSPIVQARLDPELFAKFEAMRAAKGKSASDIVRDAIAALLAEEPQKKLRYADTRPVVLPESLATLSGPTNGKVTVPIHINWSPNKTYDLAIPTELASFYRAVIREGRLEDFDMYLNRHLLIKLWPTLDVDRRLVDRWEARFPELRRK